MKRQTNKRTEKRIDTDEETQYLYSIYKEVRCGTQIDKCKRHKHIRKRI